MENYKIALCLMPDYGYKWYGGEENRPDIPEKILYPVARGDIATAKKMLDKDPDLLRAGFAIGLIPAPITSSLLHYAVKYKRKNMAGFLIDRGLDVNVKDRMDFTPLHYAVGKSNVDIAEFLISKGANVNARAAEGMKR